MLLNYTNNKKKLAFYKDIQNLKVYFYLTEELEIFQNSREKLEEQNIICMCVRMWIGFLYIFDFYLLRKVKRSNNQYFRMHESEISFQNGHRNFLGETTSGITERRRSPKSTWERPEELSCKCDLPPAWLPLACQQQVHPRENENEAVVTFPANGMQNPGRRERSGENLVVRSIGRRKSPGFERISNLS